MKNHSDLVFLCFIRRGGALYDGLYALRNPFENGIESLNLCVSCSLLCSYKSWMVHALFAPFCVPRTRHDFGIGCFADDHVFVGGRDFQLRNPFHNAFNEILISDFLVAAHVYERITWRHFVSVHPFPSCAREKKHRVAMFRVY